MQTRSSNFSSTEQSIAWMRWWYRLTIPMNVARESERRARLVSIVVFLLLLDNLCYGISFFFTKSSTLPIVIGIETVLCIVALFFNRRQAYNTAGGILTLTYTLGIMVVIVLIPHVSIGLFPFFALLIIPQVLAATVLPPGWTFASTAFNIAFIFLMLELKPLAAGVTVAISLTYFFIVITMLLLVAGISFVLVKNLLFALQQRDTAEEAAVLDRQITAVAEVKAREKAQLEQSIRMIVEAQTRYANGEVDVRVPLTADNVLWSVAGALNNLFSRLQRQQEANHDSERVLHAVRLLQNIIALQQQGKPMPLYMPSGTIVDQLAMTLLPSSQFVHDKRHPSGSYRQRSNPSMSSR